MSCSQNLKTNRCLIWGADEGLAKDSLNRDDLAFKLYSLLDLPQKGPKVNEPFEHKRRYPRVAINLPAQIRVYRLSAPRLREFGRATVRILAAVGHTFRSLVFRRGIFLPNLLGSYWR
jgi:hypothetical protein